MLEPQGFSFFTAVKISTTRILKILSSIVKTMKEKIETGKKK